MWRRGGLIIPHDIPHQQQKCIFSWDTEVLSVNSDLWERKIKIDWSMEGTFPPGTIFRAQRHFLLSTEYASKYFEKENCVRKLFRAKHVVRQNSLPFINFFQFKYILYHFSSLTPVDFLAKTTRPHRKGLEILSITCRKFFLGKSSDQFYPRPQKT